MKTVKILSLLLATICVLSALFACTPAAANNTNEAPAPGTEDAKIKVAIYGLENAVIFPAFTFTVFAKEDGSILTITDALNEVNYYNDEITFKFNGNDVAAVNDLEAKTVVEQKVDTVTYPEKDENAEEDPEPITTYKDVNVMYYWTITIGDVEANAKTTIKTGDDIKLVYTRMDEDEAADIDKNQSK